MIDKIGLTLITTFFLAIIVFTIMPRTPQEIAAKDATKAALPAGATLIYENDYGYHNKRILQIKDCFVTEDWNGEGWSVATEVFGVQCR